ncbi:sodium:proton antiporter [Mycetocola reblochoni]|uniref:Na(+)/H(+) antiporter NhaA n=2 Tax=Mycetocola reblochoni TaxID=331618 RepID=A0A1R4I6B7_9MICO|nr:Na+/H+ antiporter NhaA [Mycetocola reblochoni]RLP68207.1 sodium:proton antiporter [Mycetocola reblochoni]SJN15377.1 Na+/H+ antiporter NhaA type [Mycetocola reblochoni REB411]
MADTSDTPYLPHTPADDAASSAATASGAPHDPGDAGTSHNPLRSPRLAAGILLAAAVLAIVLANSPLGPTLLAVQATEVPLPVAGHTLSVGHWISDGLLAVFFFTAAIELRRELTVGSLSSASAALRPAIAAVGGVVAPIAVYLVIAGSSAPDGWPIPTATDIAFALGVLAVIGRGLPGRIRVFLLALAIIDDIIAIIIIAVFFTDDPRPVPLLLAAVGVAAVAVLSRTMPGGVLRTVLLIVVGVAVWAAVLSSGVHATIAGVALGLALASAPGDTAAHRLEPVVNGAILPLFAFSAALVAIPSVPLDELAAPFWAIMLALPLGKLIGITAGALLGRLVGSGGERLTLGDALVVASLGGIGFTVSLLMKELAFAGDETIATEGTLGVLLGSAISVVLAVVVVAVRRSALRRTAGR